MNEISPTCDATHQDEPCLRAPVLIRPVRLCRRHLALVMHQAARLIAGSADYDVDETADANLIQTAAPIPSSDPNAAKSSLVYFITNGTRVKIGYTTNVRSRVSSLALRYSDVVLLLAGGMDLERAFHRHFASVRIGTTEWFQLAGPVQDFIRLKATDPAAPAAPVAPVLRYPDGVPVGLFEWPDLYTAFAAMKDGATKKELAAACQISRDTAMRAIEEWQLHGVLDRRDGRSTRYYLPTS